MLVAHRRRAHAEALEAGGLDQPRRRQLARGVLEVAAARGVLERVLAAPQLGVAGDLFEECAALAAMQAEGRGEHSKLRQPLEQARAVAELELPRLLHVLGVSVEQVDVDEDVAHGAPIGSRVTHDRAAHRSRDVAGELEAGEALSGQVGDQARQLRPGLRHEQLALERACLVAGEYGEAAEPRVADEDVGGAAQHRRRDPQMARRLDSVRQRARGRGPVEVLGRAAHAIGAERRERDGLLEAGQLAPQGVGDVVHAAIVAASPDGAAAPPPRPPPLDRGFRTG